MIEEAATVSRAVELSAEPALTAISISTSGLTLTLG